MKKQEITIGNVADQLWASFVKGIAVAKQLEVTRNVKPDGPDASLYINRANKRQKIFFKWSISDHVTLPPLWTSKEHTLLAVVFKMT